MTNPQIDRLLALSERAGVSLPWAYRPGEHDDWGFIRGPEKISELIGPYRPVVANSRQSDVTEEQMAEHRAAKTDPYEPVGMLITEAVNAIPALAAEFKALLAKIAELEGELEAERCKKAWPAMYQRYWDDQRRIESLLAERDAASARVGEMREALEPFAKKAQQFSHQPDGLVNVQIDFAHFRRARLARGEG